MMEPKSNINSFIVDKFSKYGVNNIFGKPERNWSAFFGKPETD
jgi:hypothetical protein